MSEIEQLRKEINNCHVYLDECYVNDPATAPNEITLMVRLVALVKLVGELRAEIDALNERNEINEITLRTRQIRIELAQEREAENDAEIERLNAIVDFGRVANNSHLDEIIELRRTIELWKTADSKAVAAARAETAKLWKVLEGAWWQFAYVDGNGKRHCGGLSALEDIADALELDI